MTTTQTTETLTAGQVVRLMAAPGCSTDMVGMVYAVEARTLSVIWFSGHADTFTLRRNGKWARKGSGQWADYLSAA